MSRKLPNCAGCGKPLAKANARAIQVYSGVAGSPMIGTCWGSLKENPGQCMDSILGNIHRPLSDILRMIAARGPGRVMLLKGYTLGQACSSADALDAKRRGYGR